MGSIGSYCQKIFQPLYEEPTPVYGHPFTLGEGIGCELLRLHRYAVSLFCDSINLTPAWHGAVERIKAVFLIVVALPLTISGLAIYAISKLTPTTFKEVTDAIYCRTDPLMIDQIYDILHAFHTLAAESNLIYFAEAGTLLGAHRHGGIIPWDDDGDLVIYDRDKEKLERLKEKLFAKGIELQKGEFDVYKLSFTEEAMKARYPNARKVHVDILTLTKLENGNWGPVNNSYRGLFPREYFKPDEIERLSLVPFGPASKGLQIYIPENSMRYLHETYGTDCLEFGLRTHDHGKLFGFIGFRPVLSKEKVKIVDTECAQGVRWKGPKK